MNISSQSSKIIPTNHHFSYAITWHPKGPPQGIHTALQLIKVKFLQLLNVILLTMCILYILFNIYIIDFLFQVSGGIVFKDP